MSKISLQIENEAARSRDNEVAGIQDISKSRSPETSKSILKFKFEQLLM